MTRGCYYGTVEAMPLQLFIYKGTLRIRIGQTHPASISRLRCEKIMKLLRNTWDTETIKESLTGPTVPANTKTNCKRHRTVSPYSIAEVL